MLGWILSPLWRVLRSLLEALGLVTRQQITREERGPMILVKASGGRTVELHLVQGWTVRDVKKRLAERLGGDTDADQLRIIFAGRELSDDISVDSCDLGNQSVLHAVEVITPAASQPQPTAAPLSQTLVDLQLTSEERQRSEASLAMFYCWCDEADCLAPAKLRLRCGECGGGACILHQDPCSWEDVLCPRRIEAYCETCERPAWAEFYFRCGHVRHTSGGSDGHNTLALDLLRGNIRHVPCLACTDTCHVVLVFPTCHHVLCSDCWVDYAKSKLNDRQFILHPDLGYTLLCPLGCEDSHVTLTDHFKMLTSHHYQRYLRFGAEELVLQSGGLLCPQPGCGAGIQLETPSETQCNRVACPECGYVFCRECGQGAHLGPCLTSCDDPQVSVEAGHQPQMAGMAARAARARWSGADPSSVTIRVSTKPCPGCRSVQSLIIKIKSKLAVLQHQNQQLLYANHISTNMMVVVIAVSIL